MPPQKRKNPHEANPSLTSAPDATVRRSTRQRPDAQAEPDHQLRSGRLRANPVDGSSGVEVVARPAGRGKKAAITDADGTTMQTRTTRHKAISTIQPEPKSATLAAPIALTAVSPASKENVRPQSSPENPGNPGNPGRRVTQSKQTRSRPRSRSRSPPRPGQRPPSPSQSRVLVPRPPQQPAPPISTPAVPITPKRTPSNKNKNKPNTPKPPGTPRSDRNIDKIVFGNICFKAWYPSYYGKEVLGDVSANVGGGHAKMGGGKRDVPMLDRLYVCPCCFKYSKEMIPWWRHVQYCEKKAFVPGTKVYTHPRRSKMVAVPQANPAPTGPMDTMKGKGKQPSDNSDQSAGEAICNDGEWSIWEVDGEKDGLFCQNLSLFAKLFLDNKSVFFDVAGFNYFLLVYTPTVSEKDPAYLAPAGSGTEPATESENSAPVSSNAQVSASVYPPPRPRPQIVGFFSKEKMSWDNNNLACILVFPPWQRKGLGALLMGISYEISRREGVLGGPEKPISELGRKGYKRFWAGEITRWILALDLPALSTESTHTAKNTRREKERDKDQGKHNVREYEGLVVDVEKCSRDTWIAPEDCLSVLREMGFVEDAGLGPPGSEQDVDTEGSADASTHGKEREDREPKRPVVPRVKIDKAAVRSWALENKIELTRTCDPDGFVEGYAIKEVKDSDEEE